MPPKKGFKPSLSLGISPLRREAARKAVAAAMAAPAQPAADVSAKEAANAAFIKSLAINFKNAGIKSAFNNTNNSNSNSNNNNDMPPNLSRNVGTRAYHVRHGIPHEMKEEEEEEEQEEEENVLTRVGSGSAATGSAAGAGGGGGGMSAYQYRMGLPSVGGIRGVGPFGALSPSMASSSPSFNPNNLMNFGQNTGGRRRSKTRRSKTRRSKTRRSKRN